MRAGAWALLPLAAAAAPALAQGPAACDAGAVLQSYEPNLVGATKDSDDVGFLDVKLSLKYPLLPCRMSEAFPRSEVYFAATVRFAQYLGTRESSPVIGKRFNPKLFWRWLGSGSGALDYLDFGYAHESNGQSIDTPEEFRFEQQRQVATGNRPEYARDFISRGWDYVEVASKHSPRSPWQGDLTVYGSLRYFLEEGLLQGQAEEYNAWENDPEGKPRKDVQGIAVLVKHERRYASTWFTRTKLALGLETGISRPFRYNTLRLEARADLWELPLMLFYQDGYNSDLALYYKRVSTVGIALELATSR